MKKYLLKYLLALAAVLAIGTTAVQAQLKTVTRAFNEFGFTNQQAFPSGDIDENISFTTEKGNATSDPLYYTSNNGHIRLYAHAATRRGNSLVLTPKNGTVIIGVEITTLSGDGAIVYTVDGGGEQELSSIKRIENIGAGNQLVITNAHTSTYNFTTSITVTYLEAGHLFSMIDPEEINIYGSPGNTEVKTFSLAAFNLTPAAGNITLTLPADFEAAVDGGSYSGSLNLPYTGGSLAKKTVNIRLKSGSPVGNYSGTLAIAGGGLSRQVPLNASVTPATTVNAQGTKVTVSNLIFGKLNQALQGQSGITELTVSGTVDASDFKTMNGFAATLQKLDLKGVTKIQAYKGTEGPTSAVTDYPADQLPAAALTGTVLTEILLPENVINSIGSGAFGKAPLPYLSIPEGVKVLETRSFQGHNVVKLHLPTSLTHIRSQAFTFQNNVGGLKLTDITFAPGAKLEEIEGGAFQAIAGTADLILLKKFDMPHSVKKIGNIAFKDIPITELTLPDGLEELGGSQTFQQSSAGRMKLNLPQNPTFVITGGVMNGTFRNVQLTPSSFTVPDNVTEISNSAFLNTQLSSLTFSTAGNLKKITRPFTDNNYTTYVPASEPITSLVIPEGVEEIGFFNITALKTIDLPASLEKFSATSGVWDPDLRDLGVFTDCPNLESIISRAFIPPAAAPADFTNVDKTKCILYVPADAIEFYKEEPGWKDFGDNIRAIGSDAVESDIENFDDITVEAGSDPITLAAVVQGDRPVTYTIEEGKEAVATLKGNVLTIVGLGTAQITANVEGDNDYQADEKTITLSVVSYDWLEAPAIAVHGNTVKVVGPEADKFTEISINGEKGTDLSAIEAGKEVELKATTADGSEVIKLKISK